LTVHIDGRYCCEAQLPTFRLAARNGKRDSPMAEIARKAKTPEPKEAAPAKETKKGRILLVDDDYEIVESMRLALGAKGYDVIVARDGNQGLALCERDDPDLVILDMMMPKRSGFLVLEKLRRTRPVPVKVIMVTANEGSRHKAYAEMLGVDDYIRKPFAMDRLMDAVERLLG
jgi:CheY-like chemotaxis protein